MLLQRERAHLWTERARWILSAFKRIQSWSFQQGAYILYRYVSKKAHTHIQKYVYISPYAVGCDSSIDYAAEETSTKELSFPNQTHISLIIVTLPRKLRTAVGTWVKLWHFALLAKNFLLASVNFVTWSWRLSSFANTSWVRGFCAVPQGIDVFLTRPGVMMSEKHFIGNFSLRLLRTYLQCESWTAAALHFYHICY